MIVTKPAIRYMGAKFRLAPWLLQFFPAHELYTEAFGGAAGNAAQIEQVIGTPRGSA